MKWMITWKEGGQLQLKVLRLKDAQILDAELQDRNIYASVKKVKAA